MHGLGTLCKRLNSRCRHLTKTRFSTRSDERRARTPASRSVGLDFEHETGINPWAWGRFWSRFGDAQRDAGFEPNALNAAFDRNHLIQRYIELIRALGKIPTASELRVQRVQDEAFPDPKTFTRFGSKSQLIATVLDYCAENAGYEDVVALCSAVNFPRGQADEQASDPTKSDTRAGFVYLIKGRRGEYKLGHTSVVDRRLSELATGSPVDLEVVHEIKTDDPLGVEAYWHRRFANSRIKNEWFKLGGADVRAFKRWRRIF